jgi:hypothetical protein
MRLNRIGQTEQEITMSGKKTLIALSAAIALGTLCAASVAQASDDKNKWYPQDDDPGPPVPGIHTLPSSHAFGGNAYGFVPSKKLTRHAPRSLSREENYGPKDR